MQDILEFDPPEKPPEKPIAIASRSRKHVTRACNGCRITKQKCDGKNPCQTCQSKGLVCEYDSASDPGDRRKFRASAQQYNELLQQRAVLDDLCEAIRMGVADEALQRIRDGASPLQLVEILNSALRNSISDSTEFSSTPHEQVQPGTFQQALESSTPYPMSWYDDTGQMIPADTDPDLQHPDDTITPSYRFATAQIQDHPAAQQDPATWPMHSTWPSSSRVHEVSSEQLLLGQYDSLNIDADFLQQGLGPEPDMPDGVQEETDEEN